MTLSAVLENRYCRAIFLFVLFVFLSSAGQVFAKIGEIIKRIPSFDIPAYDLHTYD